MSKDKSEYGAMGRHFPYEYELRRIEAEHEKKEFDKRNNKHYKGANNEPNDHKVSLFTVNVSQAAEVITQEESLEAASVYYGYKGCSGFYEDVKSYKDFVDVFRLASNMYASKFKQRAEAAEVREASLKSDFKAFIDEQEYMSDRDKDIAKGMFSEFISIRKNEAK